MTRTSLCYIVAVLLTCCACYLAGAWRGRSAGREQGYARGYREGYDAPHPAETLVVRETKVVKEPRFIDFRPVRAVPALLPLYAPDSGPQAANRADSVAVVVPVTQAYYAGEDYRAWVSGYQPRLDSLQVFPEIREIRVQQPQQRRARVGFGITAGPAVIWTPEGMKGGAGVAAGLTVKF